MRLLPFCVRWNVCCTHLRTTYTTSLRTHTHRARTHRALVHLLNTSPPTFTNLLHTPTTTLHHWSTCPCLLYTHLLPPPLPLFFPYGLDGHCILQTLSATLVCDAFPSTTAHFTWGGERNDRARAPYATPQLLCVSFYIMHTHATHLPPRRFTKLFMRLSAHALAPPHTSFERVFVLHACRMVAVLIRTRCTHIR